MTTVYFVRHCESDYRVQDDLARPLSDKGLNDRALVTGFLRDKRIDVVLSSPCKRAFDSVSGFAAEAGLPVRTVDDFRERRVDSGWIEDFRAFSERQWADFSYKLPNGESLSEVADRNIAALKSVLAKQGGKNIVIGTHGTALSTIIHYYDRTYGFADFMAMAHLMPWVVRMDFVGDGCAGMEKIDLFTLGQKPGYGTCKERPMLVRDLLPGDVPAMHGIYAHYVLRFPYSFDYAPPSLEEFTQRLAESAGRYPIFVCEEDGALLGFAYAHEYRKKKAYQWICETTVYVKPGCAQTGIGTRLYEKLLPTLKRQGFTRVFAVLGCPNEGSERFHKKMGFSLLATFPDMGHKFDRWHDIKYYCLELNPAKEPIDEPIPYASLGV